MNRMFFHIIGLSIFQSILGMQSGNPLTLASTNPIQQFVVTPRLILHSETIKANINNPLFKQKSSFSIPNARPEDVLNLISCLGSVEFLKK